MNLLFAISLLSAAVAVTLTLKDGNTTTRAVRTYINGTAVPCVNTLPHGSHTVEISSGGKSRSFDVYVPAGLDASDIRPIVFFWHGYGGSPAKIVDFAQPNQMADKTKYILAYPKGTGIIAGFNGAGCCPLIGADDVGFFKNIVSWLTSNMCGDSNNVFSAGFSNGGFMSNRLACEVSDMVKAIAVHSGSMGKDFQCSPTKGIPALLLHGDADPTVPYFGNGQWKSFSELAQTWSDFNQCGSEANAHSGYVSQKTECIRYDACARDGVPLEFCTVQGLAHAWSGSGDFEIDATTHIFEFFESLVTV